MYKNILYLFLSMLIVVSILVDVASVYNSQAGMIFILALPVILTIAFLVLIIYAIIKRK